MNPSAVELPVSVNGRFEPAPAVGSATLCTWTPAVVYSSRNAAVALELSGAAPVPTRRTTRLPGVNCTVPASARLGAARAARAAKAAHRKRRARGPEWDMGKLQRANGGRA